MLAAVLAALIAATAGAAQAAAVPQPQAGSVHPRARVICGNSHSEAKYKSVDHGTMILRNDVFGTDAGECLSNRHDGGNYTVISTYFPTYNWNSFPELFEGCWYHVCTKHTELPRKVENIRSVRVTLWTRFPRRTIGNDATDWWFGDRAGQCYCHPNGAELMLWTDWSARIGGPVLGQTGYPGWPYLTIGHYLWTIQEYRTRQLAPGPDPGRRQWVSWNYIQFRRIGVWRKRTGRGARLAIPREPSFTNFNVMPFIRYAERRHWISPTWYADAFAAGNELVSAAHGPAARLILYRLDINGRIAG